MNICNVRLNSSEGQMELLEYDSNNASLNRFAPLGNVRSGVTFLCQMTKFWKKYEVA